MNPTTKRMLSERFLTTQELAALMGVKPVTVQKWAERGHVDYVLKGRTYLFDKHDFMPKESTRSKDAG